MPHFKSQGFRIKDMYVIVLSIPPVYIYRWFLASDGSEIQSRVENYRPVH